MISRRRALADLVDDAKALISRMRDPVKRALATAWVEYTQGLRTQRPRITADLERELARYGVVDPEGYPYDESGRSMERELPGRRSGGGEEPEALRWSKHIRSGAWWLKFSGVGAEQGAAPWGFATVKEQGRLFKTGTPVTFRFVRNTDRAPYFGAKYQQDIEPAGRYLLHNEDPGSGLARGWESGLLTFRCPLVLRAKLDDQTYGPTSWKARLHQILGKVGAELSRELRRMGHDGIVTVDTFTHAGRTSATTSEIVDLTTIAPTGRGPWMRTPGRR